VLRDFLAIDDPDPKEMTIVEHLDELRRRLIVCIVVVTASSAVGWFVKEAAFVASSQPAARPSSRALSRSPHRGP
jgi:Sec-independent protein secretion pathway component TatC